jgi:hypothetical protein
MVKRCSGCLEVHYHDRTCQKAYVISILRFSSLLNSCRRDWNRHRSICKLKAQQREGV